MILCCKCGIPIEPRLMNMCDRCLVAEVGISSKVKRSVAVERCRGCERYLQPPNNWVEFSWGSREFLLFLVKKNKTLSKLCIVDSNFVYTEPNSKKIVVGLVIKDSDVEQSLEIRYSIKNQQCADCAKVEAKQYWNSLVQVRHRQEHRRMFIYLEHLILKNDAYEDTTNIKQRKGGIDFYYTDRHGAIKMVNFLQSVLPIKVKVSERLISKDVHTSKCNYKFSYSVEIVPLCKDDLVVISKDVAKCLGVGELVVVHKIATNIILFDVKQMKSVKMTGMFYWANHDAFKVLMSSKDFKKYTVVMKNKRRNLMEECYDMTVTENGSDFVEARFHVGDSQEDDVLLGYDLQHSNLAFEYEKDSDVVLIRKEPKNNVKWKIDVNESNIGEYRLFVDDIQNDKEMLERICDIETKDLVVEELERFGMH
ncbi:ribosome stability and mRNA decay protein [Ordospora colligata]|uniref:60S ribosomal export protein NMD3 n=1 Tax=Ordospora colligata OC4 TaxID=1354746 RepID=A0A0B2UH00_9MICR|nr:ribosome stability and mRNA decay protein [Ordospora colligata OC4]KHN70336.1 ribosome stability and mRNA decay protein [Ordospora colligata OC4]TBU16880.1 ribosome stability and mRNA decay protein [Ordospora colligata]TBU16988.1 ribosome stability and mRNA decay protein [Ordospora colligata]TBU19429.1 ribosome stability and mRNA decay protein [Ordospora colligata]